jgi:hypothetical protein
MSVGSCHLPHLHHEAGGDLYCRNGMRPNAGANPRNHCLTNTNEDVIDFCVALPPEP